MKLKLLLLGVTTITALSLQAQTVVDDFSDGDDAGWTHYEPIGFIGAGGTYTFPEGAYRIQAAPSPDPATLGAARAGSLREDFFTTDFQILFDLIDFDATAGQFFGALVRASNFGFGTTTGYALGYDNGAAKQLTIARINGEAIEQVLASAPTTLLAGNDYRFVLSGEGPNLMLSVFDQNNLVTPQAFAEAMDANYTSGIFGLVVFDTTSFAGATGDATFDNVLAQVPEPSIGVLALLGTLPLLLRGRLRGPKGVR